MPKSLSLRFDGNADEVVDYARTHTIWKAMDKFGVKDYFAMIKFLKERGAEDIIDNPPMRYDAETVIDQFLFKVTRSIARLEADNHRLREENDFLKLRLGETQEDALTKMELITKSI